jgi:hypothetical protein
MNSFSKFLFCLILVSNSLIHVIYSLPRTPALDEMAEKQQRERKSPAEREGLWLPDETALYIETVQARMSNPDPNPVKRKREDDESSSEPSRKPSKKRKAGS